MLKIVFLLVDSFKLLHLLSETKPKYTREFHSGERNKKKLKVPSKLKLGNIGIDSIIKTK